MATTPFIVVVLGGACGDSSSDEGTTAASAEEAAISSQPPTTTTSLPTETTTVETSVPSTTGTTAVADEPEFLDLSAIEGSWEGPGFETTRDGGQVPFYVFVEIEDGGPRNAVVATVAYSQDRSRPVACGGEWWVQVAEPPLYEFTEVITEEPDACGNGAIRLEHDPESGALGYEYFGLFNATATLMRVDQP